MLNDIKEAIHRIFGVTPTCTVPFGHVTGALVGLRFNYRRMEIYVYGILDGSFLVENRCNGDEAGRTAFNLRELPAVLRRLKFWIDEEEQKNAKPSIWSRITSVGSSILAFNNYHTVFSLIWTCVGIYFISAKTDHGLAMGAIFIVSGLACASEQRHNDMKKKIRDLENRLSRLDNKY